MKLLTLPAFLSRETDDIPVDFEGVVACGIHSSSEVDLVKVDGQTLAVGSVSPCRPGSKLEAVRNDVVFSRSGDSLTLILFEKCDQIVTPGPRAPVFDSTTGDANDLPLLEANADIVLRLPFQGRASCAISFERSDTTKEMSLKVYGRRVGTREKPIQNASGYHLAASSVETTTNGSATVNVDEFEDFDELLLLVFGDAATDPNETYTVSARVYGELIP
jgi:hypothetical protein